MTSWPPVWAKSYRPERQIAVIDGTGDLQDEGGRRSVFWDLGELKQLVEQSGAHVYLDDFPEWLIRQAIEAGDSVSYNQHQGVVTGISWKPKRTRYFILLTRPWGMTVETIWLLREVWRLAGVGDRPTPASLGQALMATWLKGDQQRAFYPPPAHVCSILWENAIGGRVDVVRRGEWFDELYEEDRNGAYLSCCQQLPAGRVSVASSYHQGIPQYWQTRIRIPQELPLGPVAAVAISAVKRVVRFPRDRGEYTCWCWNEEADAARTAGCQVELVQGIQWEKWADCLSDWACMIYALRLQARDAGVEEQFKLSAVAGLGRFGSDAVEWELREFKDGAQPPAGAVPFVHSREATHYWCCPSAGRAPAQQPHWYSYIQAQQRLALYHRALSYAQSRELVATNYDAVYQVRAPVPAETGLGAWKTTTLHDACVPAARHLRSREKTVLPGVPLWMR